MVLNGRYVYDDDLSALDSQYDHSPSSNVIISTKVCTPLQWTAWAAQPADYPNRWFVDYILSGIHDGFRIGFCHFHHLQYAGQNLHIPRPLLVSDYLACEVQLNRMWRCPTGTFPRGIHSSPIGLIPKKNRPGKWRLIVDPLDFCVNDSINKKNNHLCPMPP